MSNYANWENIIGWLREDTCHQQARCNGEKAAKNASANLNLTATIARMSLTDN